MQGGTNELPDRHLFAAALRLVLHAHGAEIADTITTALRRLVRWTGHLTGLLDAHAARHNLAGVGAFRNQGRLCRGRRRSPAGTYEILWFLGSRLFGRCDGNI